MQKRPRQALSLLEILFTIGLLTVILVAFAAVYPAAFRLNRKSARANIAAKTSSAVGAEILALPFDPPSFDSAQANLTDLSQNAAAVQSFVYQQMRTALPEGYSVRPQAILVTLYGSQSGDPRFAQVQVTCYYSDANATGMERSVTVISGKAENRDVR